MRPLCSRYRICGEKKQPAAAKGCFILFDLSKRTKMQSRNRLPPACSPREFLRASRLENRKNVANSPEGDESDDRWDMGQDSMQKRFHSNHRDERMGFKTNDAIGLQIRNIPRSVCRIVKVVFADPWLNQSGRGPVCLG